MAPPALCPLSAEPVAEVVTDRTENGASEPRKSQLVGERMPSRRAFLKQNSLLAAGVRAAWAAPFVATSARSAPAAPIAETANGRLRGPRLRCPREPEPGRRTPDCGWFRRCTRRHESKTGQPACRHLSGPVSRRSTPGSLRVVRRAVSPIGPRACSHSCRWAGLAARHAPIPERRACLAIAPACGAA